MCPHSQINEYYRENRSGKLVISERICASCGANLWLDPRFLDRNGKTAKKAKKAAKPPKPSRARLDYDPFAEGDDPAVFEESADDVLPTLLDIFNPSNRESELFEMPEGYTGERLRRALREREEQRPPIQSVLQDKLSPEATWERIEQWDRYLEKFPEEKRFYSKQRSYAFLSGDFSLMTCYDCGHNYTWHGMETGRCAGASGINGSCDCNGWEPDYKRERYPNKIGSETIRPCWNADAGCQLPLNHEGMCVASGSLILSERCENPKCGRMRRHTGECVPPIQVARAPAPVPFPRPKRDGVVKMPRKGFQKNPALPEEPKKPLRRLIELEDDD